MTSGESSDSKAFEANGIVMEIWEPDLIVLPIPDNRMSANPSVKMEVSITNNTPTLFPFVYAILTPELLTPDGQALHPQKLIHREITTSPCNGIGIPPKKIVVCCIIAKLSWQNNWLQLQVIIFDSPKVPIDSDKSWFFEPIQLGTYQLRFTYNSPKGEFLFFDAHTADISSVEGTETGLLATHEVNLRLVEPVESNNNAVEVDSIRFETVVPERWLSVPLTQPNVDIPVQIGMRITNNSPTPLRLTTFDSLIPQLIGVDGQIPRHSGGSSLGWVSPTESDFQLVMPGENITLFPEVRLVWLTDGLLKLIVPGGGRAIWSFNNLKPGAYQIQLTYRSLTAKSEVLFEDLWMGMVHTPFVEFHLVQPSHQV